MNIATLLPQRIGAVLQMPGVLSHEVKVIFRRPKEKTSDILSALAGNETSIFILPPLPTNVARGEPSIFVQTAEVRVRCSDKPATNRGPLDVYDLVEEVMLALQWQPMRGLQTAVAERMAANDESEAEAVAWAQTAAELEPLRALQALLSTHPLYLAAKPTETQVDSQENAFRVIDVLFEATYSLPLPTA